MRKNCHYEKILIKIYEQLRGKLVTPVPLREGGGVTIIYDHFFLTKKAMGCTSSVCTGKPHTGNGRGGGFLS